MLWKKRGKGLRVNYLERGWGKRRPFRGLLLRKRFLSLPGGEYSDQEKRVLRVGKRKRKRGGSLSSSGDEGEGLVLHLFLREMLLS